MWTLRCGGDPAVSEEREARGPCKKSALKSWRSGGKWKQYWNNLGHECREQSCVNAGSSLSRSGQFPPRQPCVETRGQGGVGRSWTHKARAASGHDDVRFQAISTARTLSRRSRRHKILESPLHTSDLPPPVH